jgi:hypothetical protein
MGADYKAMRKAARLPERIVPICFRGDLVAEFQRLERELEEAQSTKTDSLDSGAGALLERMEAIQAEMRESTYDVRLRSMPHPDFMALTAKHPPRRNDDGAIFAEDEGLRVNTEDFWGPLLRASIIDPELPTVADWEEFVEGITDYQYNELAIAALNLNRGAVSVPFSHAASSMKRTSDGG